MAQEVPLTQIQDFTERFIQQWPEVFLVDVSINKANKITVLLDADNGMNVGRCADVNRALYKFVEQENLFKDNNFSIEVSSPGIDRPLTSLRQYRKNIGRAVEITKTDSATIDGKLTEATEESLTIEKEEKTRKKQAEKTIITIPFTDIRQVKVMITF